MHIPSAIGSNGFRAGYIKNEISDLIGEAEKVFDVVVSIDKFRKMRLISTGK